MSGQALASLDYSDMDYNDTSLSAISGFPGL